MKKNDTTSSDTELTGQLAKDGFELGALEKTSPIEQHIRQAERVDVDRLHAEIDSLRGEVARLTMETHQLRDGVQPTNNSSSTNNGMPDWETIAQWRDECFADCPDDFHYEDAAIILQGAGHKLFQILDGLPELLVDKVDETGMRNVRGQARWVRLKGHVALLLIRSIQQRETKLMKFGG